MTLNQNTGPPEQERAFDETQWIGRVGWGLLLIWAAVLIAWGIADPDPYAWGWRLVLELAFLGITVNIVDGITSGMDPLYMLVQAAPQDIILLLVAYPWFGPGYERACRWRYVGPIITGVRLSAARQKGKVEPFGAIGLYFFVLFPFWSTGALVGGVIGYLLGIRTSIVLASCCLGHVSSVVLLIWFFDSMQAIAAPFNSGLVKFLPWIMAAYIILLGVVTQRIGARNADDEASRNE